MNGIPDVSIIIPTYNRLRYLPEAVESALAQRDALSVEVIVVDDGSTDGTVDWVSLHSGDITYVRQRNAGQSAARNHGVGLAKGEFLVYLDSDDLLAQGALVRLIAAARYHDADLVVGNWTSFYDGKEPAAGTISTVTKHSLEDRAGVVAALPVVSAYAFRHRDVTWNEKMVVNEGVDWIIRYVAQHPRVLCLDATITHIRQHETPNRISVAYDHFDPYERLQLFDALRDTFDQDNPGDRECLRQIDAHICREAITALRRYGCLPTRIGRANRLWPHVAVGRNKGTALFLLVRLLGLRLGTRIYHALHAALRRQSLQPAAAVTQ